MRLHILALAFALPTAAMAQSPFPVGDPMTQPVTPRDIHWYKMHPDVMRQTLRVCQSNSAYALTADCQNAKRAEYGYDADQQQKALKAAPNPFFDPTFWDANPVMRATILAQCRRHGPGDELAYIYCNAAAASEMRVLNRK
ncbi:MAG TPA: hypothetical protein VHX39_14360 [Acetobacteraceae bacterium]|jgi:hypothetical protein|nr:hypothetical protein [Acetobacteraceae bacterium]